MDTILVYPPPPGGTEDDLRAARRYLERGTRERPYDAALWLRLRAAARVDHWTLDRGAFSGQSHTDNV